MLAADLFINGLLTGLFYALMAVGLALIFGILRIVNFAHGEFYMIGSYAYVLIGNNLGLSPWLGLATAALAGGCLGWATERFLLRDADNGISTSELTKDEYAVVVTFGLSLLLINAVNQVVGPYHHLGVNLVDSSRFVIGPVIVNSQRLIAGGFALVLLISTALFLKYTSWGQQVQAVAQNRFGASLAGVNVVKITSLVFIVAGALAAISGGLLAPMINPSPAVGIFPAIKSFIIIVIGGMGSVSGALVAALILGVSEAFFAVYISHAYKDALGLIILIALLIVRPHGLFGEQGRQI